MPIVGWICPNTREKEPFGHFDVCRDRKGTAAYPPWLASFAEKRILADTRHADLRLTATRCTGCPRATYIENQFRVYADPKRRAVMDRGSAQHAIAARSFSPEVWYTEANDTVRMVVEGTLFGTPITAQIDALRRDMTEIVDCKFPLDWSVSKRKGANGVARLEYAIQLNILRMLLAQQSWAIEEGFDPEVVKMVVWDHGIGKNEGPEPMFAHRMNEVEMLTTRPWDGIELGEIVDIHVAMMKEHARGELGVEELAAALPMVGESQMGGAKCTNYCDVQGVCHELVAKYGRPV